MNDVDIHRLEREVEAARAKLVTDLSRLRSPAADDNFAQSAKSMLVDKVKASTELKDDAGVMAEAVKEQSAQLAGQATARCRSG